jgi:hypothetical protein
MSNPWVLRVVRWIAVSLVLVAGPAGSLDEYLVIVNRGDIEVIVSYRPGVFQGPNMEAIALLNTPMQAPAASYDKFKKYWRIPDERFDLSSGLITFALSPGTAVVIGGVWPPTDDPPFDGNQLFMKIDGGSVKTYEGSAVVSAFAQRSRKMRFLEVR